MSLFPTPACSAVVRRFSSRSPPLSNTSPFPRTFFEQNNFRPSSLSHGRFFFYPLFTPFFSLINFWQICSPLPPFPPFWVRSSLLLSPTLPFQFYSREWKQLTVLGPPLLTWGRAGISLLGKVSSLPKSYRGSMTVLSLLSTILPSDKPFSPIPRVPLPSFFPNNLTHPFFSLRCRSSPPLVKVRRSDST